MITQLIGKNGNAIKNQFIITESGVTTFQSYKTIIAKKIETADGVEIVLDTNALNFSQTTSKYLAQFLGFNSAAELRKNLKNYKFATLN